MKYYFIYETTNNTNGKKYIGQHTTSNIDDGYLGSGKILKQAIDKYGKDNFSRKILAYANDEDELNELEKYYISKYNATESNEYYNIAEGGYGNPRAGMNEEQLNEWKRNQIEAQKGKHEGENNSMYGKKHTEETRNKIREAHKGQKHTEEWKRNQSEKMKGENNSMYGKRGKNNPNYDKGKPILMLDKTTVTPLACFNCVASANRFLGKPQHKDDISACARGRSRTSYGYKWKYITIIEL